MTYQPTDDETRRLGGMPINTSMWIAFKDAFPDAILTSGKIDHDDDGGYHPQGKGVDLVTADMNVGAKWIYDNYRQSAQLIWVNGPLLLNGQTGHIDPANQDAIAAAYGQATLSQHADHIHWGSDVAVGPGGAVGTVSPTGIGSAIFGGFTNLNAFFDALTSPDIWIRLGQIVLGAALIAFGIYMGLRSSGANVDLLGGAKEAVNRLPIRKAMR